MIRAQSRMTAAGVLLLWCIVLICCRLYMAFDKLPVWLFGNLGLAFLPVLFGSAFQAADRRKRPVMAAVSFALWLLFLPNAPYILTDLIHLAPRPVVPLWYDLAMLVSCALTGLMLGYLSLIDVHDVIDRKFSRAAGWAVASASLMLSAFGIYLGRFLRWNSWNAVTNPIDLVKSMVGVFINSGSHPHPIPVTLIFGISLIAGYFALRVIAIPPRAGA